MGTRSLTFVHDGDNAKPFVCMYRQMDGYPSGHGLELQKFFETDQHGQRHRPQGRRVGDRQRCRLSGGADGRSLQRRPGGIYLYASTSKDCWQDYEYHVYADENIGIKVKCFAVGRRKKLLFEGDVDAFGEFCNAKDD